jgi:uncharacterized protein (DUF2384 family)
MDIASSIRQASGFTAIIDGYGGSVAMRVPRLIPKRKFSQRAMMLDVISQRWRTRIVTVAGIIDAIVDCDERRASEQGMRD